jgi:hypothetical protein
MDPLPPSFCATNAAAPGRAPRGGPVTILHIFAL